MKKCNTCGTVKDIKYFYKRKVGTSSQCKSCLSEKNKIYRSNRKIEYTNPDKKICTKCNIEKYSKDFSKSKNSPDNLNCHCKECINESRKLYYSKPKTEPLLKKKCTKCGSIESVENFHKDKWTLDGLTPQCKKCRIKNTTNHYHKNKKVVNRKRVERYLKRKKIFPNVKLSQVFRNRIRNAIIKQYAEKAYSTIELLGCSIDHARKHIESQFVDNMSWENHGIHGWHIDHILPCDNFDLTDPKQQKECFHYSNLQPLWAFDNLSKGHTI